MCGVVGYAGVSLLAGCFPICFCLLVEFTMFVSCVYAVGVCVSLVSVYIVPVSIPKRVWFGFVHFRVVVGLYVVIPTYCFD